MFAFSVLATNGGYSDWSTWTQCPVTCGIGHRSRNRSCTDPPPGLYGNDCSDFGRENQTAECSSGEACPDLQNNNQTAKCNATSCEGIISYEYKTGSLVLNRFQSSSCPLTKIIATKIIVTIDKVRLQKTKLGFPIYCCALFWATSSSKPN